MGLLFSRSRSLGRPAPRLLELYFRGGLSLLLIPGPLGGPLLWKKIAKKFTMSHPIFIAVEPALLQTLNSSTSSCPANYKWKDLTAADKPESAALSQEPALSLPDIKDT